MNLPKILFLYLILSLFGVNLLLAQNQEMIDQEDIASGAIFDDQTLLEGYEQKYQDESKDILLAMLADDALGAYKTAAAIKVFKMYYAPEVLAKEKPAIIRLLIRRLNRSDSPFVQVEIMHTLVIIDRYQYFQSMVTALIQKMDHYNAVVNRKAYANISEIIKGDPRTREARIVFNTLRKILFLSRNKLKDIDVPDEKLQQKLDILRWSVKVLGTQDLKRLPSEVISLL